MNITCRKSQLVQTLLNLDNSPYSLVGREPLRNIYDIQETDRLLMMGRQYGKSTFLASDSITNSAAIKFFKTLYVSPRQEQTTEFSSAKVSPFIKHSPRLRSMILDRDCTQNVLKKTFTNGSEITLKYAYHTADAIRGISSDQVLIDEIQDIILGNVPVIEECLSGSKYQWRLYAGTPKTLNNTLSQKWEQSTQNEWLLQCPHCNVWNCIGIENIGPNGLVCKRCKKDIPRDARGEWVARKQLGPGVFLVGFRVPQVVSPMVKWNRIIEKLQTYPSAKFMNEVLALPFDNSANPVSETELKKVCCDYKNSLVKDPRMGDSPLFMGIDWGHGDVSVKAKRGELPTGYTVLTLGRYHYDGNWELLGAKKFSGIESDPTSQVQEIIRIARALNVVALGVDFGGGFMHNAILKQTFGPDRVIEWQANDALRVTAKFIPEANRMLFNRTECMTDRFVEIKQGKVRFFNWEEFRQFSPDFTTIYIDYRGDGRTMYYGHTLPDDTLHSYMMCKMTADYLLHS